MSQWVNILRLEYGGNADFYLKIENIEEIQKVLELSKKENIPLLIMGNGTNMLVKDKGIRGIVLKPEIKEFEFEEQQEKLHITAGAGVALPKLAMEASKMGYTGLEFAAGIPGTIGGAIRMNAGAYGGEMKDIVKSTTYMDLNGNIKKINNKEHEFEYRKSIFSKEKYIILSTELELEKGNIQEIEEKIKQNMESRRQKQPIDMPSAGSTFKRQEGIITAKLIDEAGLKGYTIGGAGISEKHAGFVVNKGNATAKDVLELVKYVKDTIKEKYNVNIELEVEIVGE